MGGSNFADWAALAASGVSLAFSFFAYKQTGRANRHARHAAEYANRIQAELLALNRDDTVSRVEADRITQRAIAEWTPTLGEALMSMVGESTTDTDFVERMHASREAMSREDKRRLKKRLQDGVLIDARGLPSVTVATRLLTNPLIRSAQIEGNAYRVRLWYDEKTFTLGKPT